MLYFIQYNSTVVDNIYIINKCTPMGYTKFFHCHRFTIQRV